MSYKILGGPHLQLISVRRKPHVSPRWDWRVTGGFTSHSKASSLTTETVRLDKLPPDTSRPDQSIHPSIGKRDKQLNVFEMIIQLRWSHWQMKWDQQTGVRVCECLWVLNVGSFKLSGSGVSEGITGAKFHTRVEIQGRVSMPDVCRASMWFAHAHSVCECVCVCVCVRARAVGVLVISMCPAGGNTHFSWNVSLCANTHTHTYWYWYWY